MKPKRPLRLLLSVAMSCAMPLLAAFTLVARPVTGGHTDGASEETIAGQGPVATVQVTIGPNIPHDVPQGMRLPYNEQSEVELAAFAWQQFLAMCWQSDYNTTSFSRGAPDTSWNYTLNYKKGTTAGLGDLCSTGLNSARTASRSTNHSAKRRHISSIKQRRPIG